MIHEFSNHHRPNARRGVLGAECVCALQYKILLPLAVDIAAEGDAVGRGAKVETVTVTGEVSIRAPGEKVHRIAGRAESKAGWPNAELAAGEGQVIPGRDGETCRDAILRWFLRVIREEPAFQVHRAGRGVEQLDGILLRQARVVRERLVDEDGGNRGRGWVCLAGRAV